MKTIHQGDVDDRHHLATTRWFYKRLMDDAVYCVAPKEGTEILSPLGFLSCQHSLGPGPIYSARHEVVLDLELPRRNGAYNKVGWKMHHNRRAVSTCPWAADTENPYVAHVCKENSNA